MGSFIQFAEILEQKIRQQIEEELHINKQTESKNHQKQQKITLSTTEHLDWNALLELRLQQNMAQNSSTKPLYPVKKNAGQSSRPAHQFNEGQKKSYQFFLGFNYILADNFSAEELKQAFRTLAIRLHPDHGGNSYAFRELVHHRNQLATVFNKQKVD